MRTSTACLSKVGRTPLRLPTAVEIDFHRQKGARRACFVVRGPLGELRQEASSFVRFKKESEKVFVTVEDSQEKRQRSEWGTQRRILERMVTGVTEGFSLPVRLVGVGYRAALNEGSVNLRLGHSHPVSVPVPNGVEVRIPTPQRLLLSGINWHTITQFAANIRKYRPPEPYNQKGVFVGDETIKKKEGKKR